jgi:hypothetical protein
MPARRTTTTTTTKTIGHQPRINDTGESRSSSVFSMLRKITQAEREKNIEMMTRKSGLCFIRGKKNGQSRWRYTMAAAPCCVIFSSHCSMHSDFLQVK